MVDLVAERQPPQAASVAGSSDRAPAAAEVPHLDDGVAKDLVQIFKLLADETRLRILFFLMHEEELHVRAICELLDQSQPAVSHHLALLRVAGLIDCRRDGKHNFYRLVFKRFQDMLDMLAVASPGSVRPMRFSDYVASDDDGDEL